MTDFLSRISRSALGLTPVVQVLGAPRYAPGRPVPDAGVFGVEAREVEAEARTSTMNPATATATAVSPRHEEPREANPSPAAREFPAQPPRAAAAHPHEIRAAETSASIFTAPHDSTATPVETVEAIHTTAPPPPVAREQRVPAIREPVAAAAKLASSGNHARAEVAQQPDAGDESPIPASRREIKFEEPDRSDARVPRPASAVEALRARDAAIDSTVPKRVTTVRRVAPTTAARVERAGVRSTPAGAPPSTVTNEHEDLTALRRVDETIELASSRTAQPSIDEIIDLPSSRPAKAVDEILKIASSRPAQPVEETIELASSRPAKAGGEIIKTASSHPAQHPPGEIIELPSSSRGVRVDGAGGLGNARTRNQPTADNARSEAAQPPIVRVTIGRIDVRAAAPPAPPPAPKPAPGPRLSLDDYLRQHSGRSR